MKTSFTEDEKVLSSSHAVFPFHDEMYWKRVVEYVRNVDVWTPLVLAQTLHLILQLQRDTPLKSSPEKKFGKLLSLLSNYSDFEGEASLLWGGLEFKGGDKNFSFIVWWFMHITLPHIVKLLIDSPSLLNENISLVDGIHSNSLTLSKHQCASLLAMAFFSVFDKKCQPMPVDEFPSLVTFNSWLSVPSRSNKAKLFMMMNYFERSRVFMKDEKFEIHRLKLTEHILLSEWVKNEEPISDFVVFPEGGITESCGPEVLHVDFANMYIGGGVMRSGAVQEEIMFSVCPELLVSLLFCKKMDDDEAIVLVNGEMVSQYSGYGSGLKFAGDSKKSDVGTCRVAIDAECYGWGTDPNEQWTQVKFMRELNKAYVGFDNEYPSMGADIATGNWGCGAFGGNIQLKAMLQWCSASACGRGIRYFTFKDTNCEGLAGVVDCIRNKCISVGKLIQIILDYCNIKVHGNNEKLDVLGLPELPSLFQFIETTLNMTEL